MCVGAYITNAALSEVAPQHFSEAGADIPAMAHSMMPDDDDVRWRQRFSAGGRIFMVINLTIKYCHNSSAVTDAQLTPNRDRLSGLWLKL